MGNLIDIPNSKVHPILAVLGKLGVTTEDFAEILKHPAFAEQVAELFTRRRALFELAISDDEGLAYLAIHEIDEEKVLVDVVGKAKLTSAARLALIKLPEHEAYHIARLHPNTDVIEAAVARMGDVSLWTLVCGIGLGDTRRAILAKEYERRKGHPPEKVTLSY